MAPRAALVAGLLVAAEAQASGNPNGFLSDYNKFIIPSLNHMKHGNGADALSHHSNLAEHDFTTLDDMPHGKDFDMPKIAEKEDKQIAQKLFANGINNPASLFAIGIGLLSLGTMFGVRLQRWLQPVSIVSSGGLGPDNVMEMKSQDPNVNHSVPEFETRSPRKANSSRVGWAQLSSQNLHSPTLCFATQRDTVTGTEFEEEDEEKNPERRPGHQVKGMAQVDPETAKRQEKIREHQQGCPRLQWAEEIRTIAAQPRGFAAMSTVSSASGPTAGFPSGSMVGFATLPETGMPIFCFSAMSSHTKNLLQDPRASLTVTEPAFEGAADARAIFTGNVVPLKGADADAARKAYIAAHPTAFWANFGDFKMYGFKEILDVSFVGGFARAGGVTPEEYVAAAVDPCQAFAEPVMEHMNDDHATSLQQYVEVLVGLPPVRKATMKRFDRFGIDVRCEDAVSGQGGIIRVPFETEVTERKAIKGAIVGLSKKCAALQPDWKPWAPPEKKQMAISALLFDCDGVIADTEPDGHRPAFNAAFKEKGFPDVWTKEHYGELLETGGGKERMTAHWNEVGWPSGYEDEEKQQALVKELHLRKTAIFNEMITKGEIPLRKGVLRLIDEALEAGVPVGVCSTSSEQAVSNLVRVLMGDERADKIPIYAGDVVKKKKPAPDVYLLAAEKMGLEPAKCVVIEDSSIGLAAGKAAGMNVIVTKSSYAYRENFDLADRVVDDLDAGTVTIDACNELAGSA